MSMARCVLVLVALVAALAAPAWADYEAGQRAVLSLDFSTALAEWKPLAEAGHADAQNGLGGLYHMGMGVPQNYAEAARWYRWAAEQGDADAQFSLGVLYDHGLGVPQNYAEAARWYRRAAEQGDADAQFSLGVLYDLGQGVPQNYVLAFLWLDLAANQSSGEAFTRYAKARDAVAIRLTPTQIVQVKEMTRAWKPKPER